MDNKANGKRWKREEKRFKTLDEYLSYQEQTVGKAKEISDEERKRFKSKRKGSGFELTEDAKRKPKKQKSEKKPFKKDTKKDIKKDVKKDHKKEVKKEAPVEQISETEFVLEENQNRIEGRNAVTEAFRSGRDVDKIFVQRDLHDGAISTITRMAKKAGSIINYVSKDRLSQMSQTGAHQGIIAYVASYNYSTVEDILQKAAEKDEAPFIFLLDGIEDPHNLGAIIRTANLCGAHGVIITKHRAAGLTATVAKASAGALNYTPVAKVTNLGNTIDQLKKDGMWFVCADMGGTNMYQLELKGSIGLIIGNEGEGVSRLIKEKCDFIASIPMKGDIDSLNASVAAGVMGFEISRQRG